MAESPEFPLIAPLGRIEATELRFYLERYFLTPYGTFTERARGIEARLPEWGQDLWEALPDADPDTPTVPDPVKAWKAQAAQSDRRFTVQAPPARVLRRSATEEEKAAHRTELEEFHSRKITLERRKGGAKLVSDIELIPRKGKRRLLGGWLRRRPAPASNMA